MQNVNRQTRQGLGCGFEPAPAAGIPVAPWGPSRSKLGYRHGTEEQPSPSMCAGYLVHLPEVIEASRARVHWNKGAIVPFCDGGRPTEPLLVAIEVLESECNAFEHWALTKVADGGGRE